MNVSVIIPTYNEEKSIRECLESLSKQTFRELEVIAVDDGSTDKTLEVLPEFPSANWGTNFQFQILRQKHKGPGIARNLGVKAAVGEILVFVDADMTFDKKFIEMLIRPIKAGKCIGTFSKDELVSNKDNAWSKCWNINKGLPINEMHPKNYPDEQLVFRAILKKEFENSGGFSPIGYIDDHTISENLGKKACLAKGAIFYHKNPDNLVEIFNQARWIGKSEYKRRKIKQEQIMRLVTIIRYSLPLSLAVGVYKSVRYKLPQFLLFKLIYDLAIEISIFKSYFGEQKYK